MSRSRLSSRLLRCFVPICLRRIRDGEQILSYLFLKGVAATGSCCCIRPSHFWTKETILKEQNNKKIWDGFGVVLSEFVAKHTHAPVRVAMLVRWVGKTKQIGCSFFKKMGGGDARPTAGKRNKKGRCLCVHVCV